MSIRNVWICEKTAGGLGENQGQQRAAHTLMVKLASEDLEK